MNGHNQPAFELSVESERLSITIAVLFATDKADIIDPAYADLRKVIDFMAAHPQARVTIEGHTDSRGSAAYNQNLSERRAQAVRQALIKLGADSSRLDAKGYGEARPVASNNTPEGMAKNRRVVATAQSGGNITQVVQDRLESLTLTDNRGLEADQLDIILSDHDGALPIPPKGAVLKLALGWAGSGLIDKGTFMVDEIEHTGTPDRLTIRARSADFRDSAKTKKARSFHGKTLGQIVSAIAKEHSLTPKVAKELSGIAIEHIDQTDESDLNILTRLVQEHDGTSMIKSGCLLVFRPGQAVTPSGKPIPAVTLTRGDGDQHRYASADRDGGYTGVKAHWNSHAHGKRQPVVAGDEGKLKVLRKTYHSEGEAKAAAHSELKRVQRTAYTFILTLALGRPDITPETPAVLLGWKAEIDRQRWLVAKATHSLSSEAMITMLELENVSMLATALADR